MKVVLLLLSLTSLCAPLLLAADLDNDGLPDETEELLAESFLPRIYFHEEESCAGPGVILYHARPFAPGVDTVVSLTYVLLFYDDCGGIAHDGDAETFSLTLFADDSCPTGYRAHSIRTFAHAGVPICDYRPSFTIENCSFSHQDGDAVYCSKNGHALYPSLNLCNDPERWYCLDECQSGLVMNDGWLVPPEANQYWYLFNAGEIDYPIVSDVSELGGGMFGFASCPVWDFRHFCGDESYTPGDYCPSTIVNKLFTCASGPNLPVDISFRMGGAVPSPMGYCRDQFLYLDLPYGGNVFAHIYSIAGDVVDKVYLPAFCASEELIAACWDGGSVYGGCSAPGNYYLQAEAQRGDDHAFTDIIRFGVAGDEGRPRSPANLTGSGNSHTVYLSWTDRSQVEDAYIVERSLYTCPFFVVGVLPENTTAWTDTPLVEGTARYRVCAHRTFGGNSSFSNEIQLDLRWDVSAPVLDGAEMVEPHAHLLNWSFDAGELDFEEYVLLKRYRCPPGLRNDGDQPPGWSTWYDIFRSETVVDSLFVDSIVVGDNCYEYLLQAVLEDGTDTLRSNIVNFHGDCEEHGCPVLSIRRGDRWEKITNVLPAPAGGASRENDIDFIALDSGVFTGDDEIALRIEESTGDTTFLDAILLQVFDAAAPEGGEPGIVVGKGITVLDHTCHPPVGATRAGHNVLDRVSRRDGVMFYGEPGDVLLVDPGTGGDGDSLLGILGGPVEDPPAKVIGPIVSAVGRGGRDASRMLLSRAPVRGGLLHAVDLAPAIREYGGGFSLEIVLVSPCAIDLLCRMTSEEKAGNTVRCEISRAETDEGVDVTDTLLREDGRRTTLEKRDCVTLYFDLPPGVSASKRFFLEVRGFYVSGSPGTP